VVKTVARQRSYIIGAGIVGLGIALSLKGE
jgi:glycine/D-amino acid oxidase-like deaminating enzyme